MKNMKGDNELAEERDKIHYALVAMESFRSTPVQDDFLRLAIRGGMRVREMEIQGRR